MSRTLESQSNSLERMKSNQGYIEKEVDLPLENRDLNGIITFPVAEGPYPAIVLLHGSDRSGKEDPYYREHANNLVKSGFAVLRYDGPGWGGGSSDGSGFETLEYRTEEAIAVVKFLQSRSDIQANSVGLWGISQGGWICQMAAAIYKGISFIIPISGPGVTPAEQEVYRVEAESRAAGFDDDKVAKAVLMRRLMVDVVFSKPIYQVINQEENARLGDGAWNEIVELIYNAEPVDPTDEFVKVMDMLNAVASEAWTKYLHLEQVLPMFESLPSQAWEMAKGQMRAVQEVDPADFLTRVFCPVLAIFGDADTSIPVEKSVALYRQYLKQAGNQSFTIKVFPKASHTIKVSEDFAPGYFSMMNSWLSDLPFIP